MSRCAPRLLLAAFLPVVPLQADVLRGAPAERQFFDEALELYMSGDYVRADQRFGSVIHLPEWAARATVASSDCQLGWGDSDAALATLAGLAEPLRTADWFRAAAGAQRVAGRYELAIELGHAALLQDPAHLRARYELAALLEYLGRTDEALAIYRWFNDLLTERLPESAADLHYAGLGFYRYSVLSRVPNLAERTQYVLQEILQPACMMIDLGYWPARLAIADLLREKYRPAEALDDYRAVLRRNPQALEAHLGLGRLALAAWDFENVELRVGVCLDINPRSVEARVLLAELRMLERRYAEAEAVCREALTLNPVDIAALAFLAAAQLRRGQDSEARVTQQTVAEVNPTPAAMHTIIGKQLSDARQFAEAEAHLLQAIEFDPTNPTQRNELAMMYMQWGREEQALEAAEAAFALDQFNDRTKHTLDLLDVLRKFTVYRTEHFEIHYDSSRDAVIGPGMGAYLESIYAELLEDYETELSDPTIIEVFPDHRQFGVRIHGKPWIHTVGACTGRVIAMDAPRESVGGVYHYAAVLRHEFTHTVTLAATHNRIPHWLTEGLAVLQEDHPRSWNWMMLLAQRLRRGELFSLESIDWGFIRPRRANDRLVAYAQSEWMCEFLIDRFGYDIINKMLRRFREGAVQADVLPELTGLTEASFDQAFQQWARTAARDWGLSLEPPLEAGVVLGLVSFYPRSPNLLSACAALLLEKGDAQGALTAANSALAERPQDGPALLAAARSAQWLANQARSRQEQASCAEQARHHAAQLAETDPQDPDAVSFLAEFARAQGDLATAGRWAQRLQALQPLNPESPRVLSALALHQGNDDQALNHLLQLARQENDDPDVPRQLARIYRNRSMLHEAGSWYQQALYIDPYDVDTRRLYAGVLADVDLHDQAADEYRTLTLLEPANARHASDLAFAYFRAGQRDRALDAARRAVELDPASPARQLLSD